VAAAIVALSSVVQQQVSGLVMEDAQAEMKLHTMSVVFAEKALATAGDVEDRKLDVLKLDPLGLGLLPAGDEEKSDAVSAPRFAKRKAKKATENIFSEFGKAHDSQIFQDIDIGGVTIQRFDVRKFWKNDTDIKRWQTGMGNRSRYSKLMLAERGKYHEDIRADTAELSVQHNAGARARSGVEADKAAWQNKVGPSIPLQLRELHRQLKPQEKKKKLVAKGHFGGPLFGGLKAPEIKDNDKASSKDGDLPALAPVSEGKAMINQFLQFVNQKFSSLENAFRQLDVNGNGSMSFSELSESLKRSGYGDKDVVKSLWKTISSEGGTITVKEWMNLKPYMIQMMAGSGQQQANERKQSAGSKHQTSSAPSPLPLDLAATSWEPGEDGDVQDRSDVIVPPSLAQKRLGGAVALLAAQWLMPPGSKSESNLVSVPHAPPGKDYGYPRTLSLLLFKNGDMWHAGETVYLKRTPSSLEHLLILICEQCSPFVRPVEALLDENLRPVRSLDDIINSRHKTFLIKGKEIQLDPPTSFFKIARSDTTSLRKLNGIKEACQTEALAGMLANPSRSSHTKSMPDVSKASTMSSRPKTSELPAPGAKWQPSARLAASLSWGGSGQGPIHHCFDTWRPVSRPGNTVDLKALTM